MKNHGMGSVASYYQRGAERGGGRSDQSLRWNVAHTQTVDRRLQIRASAFLEPSVMTLSVYALT
jgi:hypothetical protein